MNHIFLMDTAMKFCIVCLAVALLAIIVLICLIPITKARAKKRARLKQEAKEAEQQKLFDLSKQYGDKLKYLLDLYIGYFGDTYITEDAWGDDYSYKRLKDCDEDTGENVDMTSSRIWVDNKLIFDAYGHPQILEDHHILHDLLDFEDKLMKVHAQKQAEERRKEQERDRLKKIRDKINYQASTVTCYLGKSRNFQDDRISIRHLGGGSVVIEWKDTTVFEISAGDDISPSTLDVYRPGTGQNDWEDYLETFLVPKAEAVHERQEAEQEARRAKSFTPLSDSDFS